MPRALWEARRIRQLSGGLVPFAALCMHGEADSGTDQSVYEGDLYKWQRDLEADLNVACETLGRTSRCSFFNSRPRPLQRAKRVAYVDPFAVARDPRLSRPRSSGSTLTSRTRCVGSPDDVHFLQAWAHRRRKAKPHTRPRNGFGKQHVDALSCAPGVARTGASQFTATLERASLADEHRVDFVRHIDHGAAWGQYQVWLRRLGVPWLNGWTNA